MKMKIEVSETIEELTIRDQNYEYDIDLVDGNIKCYDKSVVDDDD